ncbi:MAG: hypothetical protein AAGU21_01200 [Solidesulfovibrio sp.]|uniref:hypothetical protein n=1 Tax=Solidesulfovibrio sp. TaxID=2910990 RepID=UPI002B20764B|nr:hypothetical protein [Solidesulfovibrio sp.]MEA4857082.1 hypothetical protein [Solidesulfovibrio sp.]
MLTMVEREDAAGVALYRLMFRLLKDYYASGKSTRPPLVRYPGQLSMLVAQLEAASEDCRELLRRKLQGEGDARNDPHDPGLAGGDGVAGGNGRLRTSAG